MRTPSAGTSFTTSFTALARRCARLCARPMSPHSRAHALPHRHAHTPAAGSSSTRGLTASPIGVTPADLQGTCEAYECEKESFHSASQSPVGQLTYLLFFRLELLVYGPLSYNIYICLNVCIYICTYMYIKLGSRKRQARHETAMIPSTSATSVPGLEILYMCMYSSGRRSLNPVYMYI